MFNFFESLLKPFPEAKLTSIPNRFGPFIWILAKPSALLWLSVTVMVACFALIEIYLYGLVGQIVDALESADSAEGFLADNLQTLQLAAVLLLLLPAWQFALSLLRSQGIFGNFPMRLRWLFHRYLLDHSLSFFSNEFSGRLSTKVMQTALAVRDVLSLLLDTLVYVTVTIFATMFLAASLSPTLLVPFVLWGMGCVSIYLYFVPKLSKVAQWQADTRSVMTGRVTDAYSNILTVKLFSHHRREMRYARDAMQIFLDPVYRQMRLATQFDTLIQLNNSLLFLLGGGWALNLWLEGRVGAGAIAVVATLTLRLSSMAHWVMWEMSRLFENIGTVYDGIETLSQRHTIVDRNNASTLQVAQGQIEFENLSFEYRTGLSVVTGLNLRIAPGEKVGLVGRSGAGKSTLVNLLLRFYDIDRGRITIDGTDISDVTQESLRANIGMVTQDTSLLHRSIRENIAYGCPNATDEQIWRAIRMAAADEFVDTLEDQDGKTGLDAYVGERGVKLSGGQRQRIAIARVMLKNAPILLLDEATSALDSEVEASITQSLYQLMEGKTVIAIAHRLSTIAKMDRLVVMDQGCIVETGTHTELLEKGGIYAQLWQRQSGGFLVED
ncbi:MAG: ABC transporter ATP-binding protein [Gammaproteobacteria bacterium]|nr:ABC transporter ATP-binding protein [Gammaproteobacteria bacterium]